MNKKQFFRLSIVLIFPALFFSWWASNQDDFLPQSLFVQCYVEDHSCSTVYRYNFSENNIQNNNLISQVPNGVIILLDFNESFDAYHYDSNMPNMTYVKDPSINHVSFLSKNSCDIYMSSGLETAEQLLGLPKEEKKVLYHCNEGNLGDAQQGVLIFKNPNDVTNLASLFDLGNSKLGKEYKTKYLLFIGIFISISIVYLLLALIIKFIIYGYHIK